MSTLKNYYRLEGFIPRKGTPTKRKGCLLHKHTGRACLCKINPETNETIGVPVKGLAKISDTSTKVKTGIIYVLIEEDLVPIQ